MPDAPDDEKTLAVPSAALLDDVPSTLDSRDEGERTQKFAFDARELDAAIGALEDAALSIPVTVAEATPRTPLSRDAPTTRPERDFTPSGERPSGAAPGAHSAVTPARGTPASAPRPRAPDVAEKETVAPGSGRRANTPKPDATRKPFAATLPVASGMKSPLGAPPPDAVVEAPPARLEAAASPEVALEAGPAPPSSAPVPASVPAPLPAWFAGYLVTCIVLTVMGLVVLWFEHRALGHLLP